MKDEEFTGPDLAVHGVAYKYRDSKRGEVWLDPTRVTVYTKMKDGTEPVAETVVLPKDSARRRMVKFLSKPGRILSCFIISFVVTWLLSGHHVPAGTYWLGVASVFFGYFLLFWITELHNMAGGHVKLD